MSTMQHLGKGIIRTAKNYTKGYSDVQTKVRDATSNDPWGPTGQQMNEIAQMTYNQCVSPTLNFLLVSLLMSANIHVGMTLSRLWRCLTSG